MSFHTLTDTDIFWHLKTGEIIWNSHQVPQKDIYSFTVAGKEWIDAQWLFQLIIYSLYRFSGYTGMILFGAMLTAITWALIMVPGINPNKYFAAIALGLLALLVTSARLRLRPEILSFFYIAMEIFLIGQFRRGKKWALYPLPLLLLLWVNSEGLWPIYFVILGAFLGEEILFWLPLRAERYFARASAFPAAKAAAGLLICLSLSVPLVFVNPYGSRGALFPFTLLREASAPDNFIHNFILEFLSPFDHKFPLFFRSIYVSLLAVSALAMALSLFRRRGNPASFLLWAGFLYLSLSAVRNVTLFAVVTVALVGVILSENPGQEIFPFPRIRDRFSRFRAFGAIGLLVFMSFVTGEVAASRFFLWNKCYIRFGVGVLENEYPIRGCQLLKRIWPELGMTGGFRIFNEMDTAGYLIWSGWPEWKVYTDPRLEVYGDKFFAHTVPVFTNWQAFEQEDDKYDFNAAILSSQTGALPFLKNLYQSPKWALVYLDGQCLIFLKRPENPDGHPLLSAAIQKYQIDFKKSFEVAPPPNLQGPLLAQEKFRLGYLLSNLGQHELAVPEFEEAIKINPKDPNVAKANSYLGRTLFQLKRFPEALPYLEKSASMEPGAVATQIRLGRAYAMTGQPGKGLEIFQAILAKDPRQITACMDIAKVHELILKSGEAAEAWQRCWAIYQSDPEAFQPAADEISQALARLKANAGSK